VRWFWRLFKTVANFGFFFWRMCWASCPGPGPPQKMVKKTTLFQNAIGWKNRAAELLMNSPLISMKSQTFVFGHLNMGIGSRCGAAGPGLPTCSKYRPFFKKVKTEKKFKKT
jgi:hypothetical protein